MNQLSLINTNRLKISGDLNFDTVQEVTKEAQRYLEENPLTEIDFAGVKNCNSGALLLLLSLWRQALAQNQSIAYLNLPLQLSCLISLTHLDDLLSTKK